MQALGEYLCFRSISSSILSLQLLMLLKVFLKWERYEEKRIFDEVKAFVPLSHFFPLFPFFSSVFSLLSSFPLRYLRSYFFRSFFSLQSSICTTHSCSLHPTFLTRIYEMANSSSVVFRFVDGDGETTTTTKNKKDNNIWRRSFPHLLNSRPFPLFKIIFPSQVFKLYLFTKQSFVDRISNNSTIFKWCQALIMKSKIDLILRFNTNKINYLRTSIVNYTLDNIFTCIIQDSSTILKIHHNEINSWLMRLFPAAFFVATQNDQLHVYAYPLYLYIACTVCHYILRCFCSA